MYIVCRSFLYRVALQTATVLQNIYGLEGNIAAEFLGVKMVNGRGVYH
jgi:hypothetical protein